MMNMIIESPSNPRIKELVKLRESPRRRKERGLFFVEGAEDLEVLLKAGRKVEEVYGSSVSLTNSHYKELLNQCADREIPVIETSVGALEKASYRSAGNDLIGLVKTWNLALEAGASWGNGPLVVLDEVEKPGNLGAILRSVEAFGAAGLILSDPHVDFFNPNVVRASRGLLGRVPVARGTKEEVLRWLENSNRVIWATSSKSTQELGKEVFPESLACVFGSEQEGLGEFWQKAVKKWIKIPMRGTASSLNLNVSVGCLLYESNRS
jgi:TrmH family RNA methyltransferase